MKKRIKDLMDMFPYFFDKSETSNFFKSQSVTNNQLLKVFQTIHDVYESLSIRKKCLIWKTQTEEYNYTINFVANYPSLKSVKCYKNDTLLYMEEYLEKDNVSSFVYSYDSSEDIEVTNDTPIIPEDTFNIIVETYDEYIIKKGFPENDTILGNIYDHDESLDEIGALNGIQRKTYKVTDDYAHTEPPYNNRLSEDDYHYMNRIIEYNLRLHDTPLPVLEIWKEYSIFSDMINREQYLLKMFDERMHPFDEETGLVGNWTPQPWEHKDTLCDLQADLGKFFFVSANTLLPVKNQSVRFTFQYLNSLAEKLIGDYNVTISLRGDEEDTVIEEHFTGEQYTVSSEDIDEDDPNVFIFNAYEGETLFATEEITVNVRGCNTGDWYVSTSGNDSNTGKSDNPFATLDKALSMVNGDENLIVLTSGTHSTDHIYNVPYTCTVLGCGDPIISNTTGLKFFKVYQNQSLNIQDITLKHDDNTVLVENSNWINNNLTTNPLYVVISEGEAKTSTILTLSTNKSTYTIGETIEVTGSLTDDEETGLSGKSIKIYVNNTLVDTVTTQGNSGGFSKNITANTAGSVSIKAVFESDEDYASSNATETVTVNKKTTTITFAASKASYDLGETISLSGTLKSGNTNIGSASVKIYDGDTLLDTVSTNASGAFSKSISASVVASKTYRAVYEGDNTYTSVTSSDVSVSIVKRTPTISLATSSASVSAGGSYTLSGALLYSSSGVGSASIKIYDGATLVDTVTTGDDGTFSKSFTNAPVASHTYKAVYDGDSTYNNVESSTVSVDVGKITPTISLSASSATITYGDTVTLSGTLSVGSGVSVKIYDGATLVDTVTTGTAGAFSKTVSGLTVGSHTFTAVYEGDSTYASVTSSSVSVTVNKITSTISLSASSTNITYGDSVTVSGTLSVGAGVSVKLYSHSTLIATLTTGTNGAFSKTFSGGSLGVGSYIYTAVYEGDSTHTNVTSSSVTVTVNKITSTISLSASPSTATYGTDVVLSGTLSVGSGKSVKIYNGETLVDTVTTSTDGAYSKTVSNLSVGNHTFTAEYDGDNTHTSVTSSGASVTINKITPTITLSVPATGTVGTIYTVSGTLANPNTGTVKIYRNNSYVTSVTATGGSFSYSVRPSAAGTFTYYAVYEGDSTHEAVTSSTGSIVVSGSSAPASITLTTDKPIMMKDETATITATVLDGNGDPCEGETVSFEVVDGESLGTATTDSSGQCSVYYLGNGVGDLNIKAECRLLIQTCSLKDAWYYHADAFTSTQNNFNVDLPSNFEISFITKRTSSSGNSAYLEIGGNSSNTALMGQIGGAGVNDVRIYDSEGSSTFTTHLTSDTPLNQDANQKWAHNGSDNTFSMNSSTVTWTDNKTHSKIRKLSITNNQIRELLVMPL